MHFQRDHEKFHVAASCPAGR